MSIKAIFTSIICSLLFCLVVTQQAIADNLVSHAPVNAEAYIIEPKDGATVPETFTVEFGLSGMELAPAGVDRENTGHHHLLIDRQELPDLTTSIPASEQILHFGKAQTETELTLSPGNHTLQLVLGNYVHIPHDNPVISEPITVTVK